MASNVSKVRVLSAIDSERERWESLVADVGDDRMEIPGVVGEWTFKDTAAHLNAWRQRSLDRLEAASRGEPDPASPVEPDSDKEDEMNAEFYRANRDRPVQDVLAESRETFTRLRGIVQAFSEEDLSDPNRFPWLDGKALGPAITDGSYFSHLHDVHEPDIRAWLSSRS